MHHLLELYVMPAQQCMCHSFALQDIVQYHTQQMTQVLIHFNSQYALRLLAIIQRPGFMCMMRRILIKSTSHTG